MSQESSRITKLSTQFEATLDKATADRASQRVDDSEAGDSLFALIDKDGDGAIDKAEFQRIYGVIKKHVVDEHAATKVLEAKEATQRRRVKVLGCVGGVMALFLGLSVAANSLAIVHLLEASKDTAANATTGALSVKLSNGKIASTAVASEKVPLSIAHTLDFAQLAKVTACVECSLSSPPFVLCECDSRLLLLLQINFVTISVIVNDQKRTNGFTITGFERFDNLSMVLRGTDGMVLHLDGGAAALQTTGGTFDVCGYGPRAHA